MTNPNALWQAVMSPVASPGDDKKRRIVEATIDLMAKEGIAAVTFDHVGQKLGTTKANVKYHFKDKDHLIFTATRLVVVNAQMITARLIEKVQTPEEKLAAVVAGAYEWLENYPDHATVWLLFMYYAQFNEDYAKFFLETRRAGQSRMQLVLRALARSGNKEPDYAELTELIQNFLYGQLLGLTGKRKDLKKSYRQSLETISQILAVKGIKWPIKR